MEIIKHNLARKEAMLRYNTNFFYMLDDLIENENRTETNFNSQQENDLKNMFKLFFDLSDEQSDFVGRSQPRQSRFDDYSNLIDNDYNLEDIYDLDVLRIISK